MAQLTAILDRFPIGTAIVYILAIVGGIDLIQDGELSDDFATYAAIVGGTSGLTSIGRGIRKQGQPIT